MVSQECLQWRVLPLVLRVLLMWWLSLVLLLLLMMMMSQGCLQARTWDPSSSPLALP